MLEQDANQGEISREVETRWSMLFLIFGIGMAAAFQVGKVPPVLPLLRNDLGLSLFLAGWVLSAFNVLGAMISPMAGAVSDWLGHRRLIMFGLGCMTIGSFAGAYAQSAILLLGSRFLEGLGYIFIIISAPGLIIRVVGHKDLRIAFGIWGAFMPAGGATMMVMAPFLVSGFGWRGMWHINAGLLFGFIVLVAWTTRDLAGHKIVTKSPLNKLWADIWQTLRSPGPALLALCFATYAFQFLVVIGFLPTLLIEEEGLQHGLAAILSAIALAANVPGNLLGGWLLQKGVKRWLLIMVASLIMGFCCLVIYVPVGGVVVRYVGCIIFMGAGGMIPASLLHGAAEHAPRPELVSTSNGLLMQGAQIGLLSGPPLVAFVVSRTGTWQSATWVLAIVALIGIGLSLGLRSVERRKRERMLL